MTKFNELMQSNVEGIDARQAVNGQLQFHEYANIFPWIEGKAFEDFKADIQANGIREPIVLFQGKILDGRNRYNAAIQTGVPFHTTEFEGTDDEAVRFVVSLNLYRRHLDSSQRGLVADKLANMKQGARTDLSPIGLMSQAQAAEMLNVSLNTVKRARVVNEHGAPELVARVEAGSMLVSTASDIATLPKDEQTEIVAKGEAELKAAKEIREKKAVVRRAELKGRSPAGCSPRRQVWHDRYRSALANGKDRARRGAKSGFI